MITSLIQAKPFQVICVPDTPSRIIVFSQCSSYCKRLHSGRNIGMSFFKVGFSQIHNYKAYYIMRHPAMAAVRAPRVSGSTPRDSWSYCRHASGEGVLCLRPKIQRRRSWPLVGGPDRGAFRVPRKRDTPGPALAGPTAFCVSGARRVLRTVHGQGGGRGPAAAVPDVPRGGGAARVARVAGLRRPTEPGLPGRDAPPA